MQIVRVRVDAVPATVGTAAKPEQRFVGIILSSHKVEKLREGFDKEAYSSAKEGGAKAGPSSAGGSQAPGSSSQAGGSQAGGSSQRDSKAGVKAAADDVEYRGERAGSSSGAGSSGVKLTAALWPDGKFTGTNMGDLAIAPCP